MQLLRHSDAVPPGNTIIGGVNSKNLHHAVDARHVYTDGTHVTDDRSCRKPSMSSLSQRIITLYPMTSQSDICVGTSWSCQLYALRHAAVIARSLFHSWFGLLGHIKPL